MSKLDKIISIAFVGLTITDFLIYIFWIPDFHWLLLLIPINVFNLVVLVKKPASIIRPYKFVSYWFIILTLLKILTFANSTIWIIEYVLSGAIGLISLISHIKYEK